MFGEIQCFTEFVFEQDVFLNTLSFRIDAPVLFLIGLNGPRNCQDCPRFYLICPGPWKTFVNSIVGPGMWTVLDLLMLFDWTAISIQ